MNKRYTPERITSLAENEIFVFGSNLAGAHGGGAARLAYERFGAVWGQGVGLHGQSYAIPTMEGGVETIKPYVDEFIRFAKENVTLTFLVTRIGCGIAGFRDEEIAPLFKDAIEVGNIILPKTFVEATVISKAIESFDADSKNEIDEDYLLDVKTVSYLKCIDLSTVTCDSYSNFINEEKSTIAKIYINKIGNQVLKYILENIIVSLNEAIFMNLGAREIQEIKENISFKLNSFIRETPSALKRYCVSSISQDCKTKNCSVSIYIQKDNNKYYYIKIDCMDLVGFTSNNVNCKIYHLSDV